ncbi:MAG: L,D-transpeptidase family protein [Bacilli bacterium]|nr:L,D-transpeptidase family protein [Bacilli bacterium]
MRGKHSKKVHVGKVLVPILIAGTIIYVGTKSGEKYKEYESRNEIQSVQEQPKENDIAENIVVEPEKEETIEEPTITETPIEKPVIEEPKEVEKPTVSSIDGLEIETRKVVKATTSVNVRDGASLDSDKLTVLSTGNTLNLMYQENEDWYKVDYQGQDAYVSTHYSTVVDQTTIKSPVQKMVYFKNDSTLYGNDLEEESLMSIPKLEATPIYGETETHYVTALEDKVGYIRKSDTGVLEGTFAIVDISDQTAYLYENNEMILSTPVVTGKNSTPTTKGLHEVWLMEEDRYLTGADFKVHVKVVAFFHNGEGIHDASWRSAFGGELYKNGGSHGCVNMPTEAAVTFYKNLEVGDKVLVKQ